MALFFAPTLLQGKYLRCVLGSAALEPRGSRESCPQARLYLALSTSPTMGPRSQIT